MVNMGKWKYVNTATCKTSQPPCVECAGYQGISAESIELFKCYDQWISGI